MLKNAFENLSTEAKQDALVALLQALLAELEQKAESGEPTDLDTMSLSALKSIVVTVANLPGSYPIPANQVATIRDIRDLDSARDSIFADDQADEFWRIKNERFKDTEEVRYEIANTDKYIGVAFDGSATTEPIWTVIRTYLDASQNPIRERIRTNVAWDNRTIGW